MTYLTSFVLGILGAVAIFFGLYAYVVSIGPVWYVLVILGLLGPISFELIQERYQKNPETRGSRTWRAVDALHFGSAVPFVGTALYELLYCSGGVGACALNPFALVALFMLLLWAVLTLVVLPFRVKTLLRLGSAGTPTLVCYCIFTVVPALLLASFFFA